MPRRPTSRWTAADGTALHMRPVRADDAERLHRSLAQLSPEARRQRFLAPVASFSNEFVQGLTEGASERQHVLLVLRKESGEEISIAGGRFIVGDTPETRDTCEFALIIGDVWQGQGIGRRLLQALIAEAQARNLRQMVGHILLDNRTMLTLARHSGFSIEACPGDARTRLAILDLPRRQPSAPRGLLERIAGLVRRRNNI